MDGKNIDEKVRLNISGMWVEISFFNSYRIWLEGYLDHNSSVFSEDIITFTLCESAAAMNNDSPFG